MDRLLNSSKLFLKKNASTILTVAGGVGVVATSVMAVKATPKAVQLLEEAEQEKGDDLTTMEKVKVAGPAYIPAVITGVSTIACIFGANILNKKTQASLTSAYALLDNAYKDYKKKVDELYGEDAEGIVRREIAKDKYEESDIQVEDDTMLFYDYFSSRYFESTIEAVQRAEYRINRHLNTRDYATINEFYDELGLEHIDGGDLLGWSSGMNYEYYWQSWIDFSHEKVVMDDGLECRVIYIQHEPHLGFDEY